MQSFLLTSDMDNSDKDKTEEIIMLEIQNTLISLDLVERFFCCDLSACKGACCIEGDAGAPITESERRIIEKELPAVYDELTPAARREIDEHGVSYIDEEGDLVTTIVNGRDCVFTCYDREGTCLCAFERLFRQGKCSFKKPASCYLYPVRITEYDSFTAVNFHRWKICKPAETLGRKLGLRAYQFLKEPLIARFGQEWYDELCLAAETLLEEQSDNKSRFEQ